MNNFAESSFWMNDKRRAGWVSFAAPASKPRCDDVNPPGRLACAKSIKRESRTEAPVDSVVDQIHSLADYVNNEFTKIKREFNTTLLCITSSGYSVRA